LARPPWCGGSARSTASPLSPDAVARLAEPHGVDAGELYRKTGGNPFFVAEALATGARGIPDTVREAVLARAARLSPAGGSLLEAVAVVPPQAELWLLEALAGDAAGRLDECLTSGMLVAAPAGVSFRHELVRLAVEQRQHVKLAGGEPGRVGRRGPPGTARQPPHAELPQPPGHDRRRRPRPQPQQLLQGAAQRLLLVGVGQGERGLVGAAGLAPAPGRPLPLAGELQRVPVRDAGRDRTAEAGAPAPVDQLTGQQPPVALQGERQDALGRLGDGAGVALQPGGLGPGRRDRRQPPPRRTPAPSAAPAPVPASTSGIRTW
jgi:hypothetical protein